MTAGRFKGRPQGKLPSRPRVVEGLVDDSEGVGVDPGGNLEDQ